MEKLFPEWLAELWKYDLAGNSVGQVATALFVFFAILIGIKVFQSIVLRKLELYAEKTTTKVDNALVQVLRRISKLFYILLALFLTTEFYLHLEPSLEHFIKIAFIVMAAYEVLKIAQAIIFYGLSRSALGNNKTSLHGIKMVANIALWAVGALLVLDNVGVNISALAASLGIGGIAIALAAQNILGDLFSSFTIYFDKPFQVGDYIVIGDHEGTVKKIGLKTTRIHALRGEELVISNKELTESRVQNFKKLETRRVEFRFGVTYDTPTKKLRLIPKIIEDVIKNIELAEFMRANFYAFESSSLEFVVIYRVSTGSKVDHMNTQEMVNLGILERFETEEIEMAFPTQTIYMKKD